MRRRSREIFETVRPYVSLPTTCEEPMSVTIRATSWQQPDVVHEDVDGQQPLTGCDEPDFQPKPTSRLSSDRTTTPSGFDFTLEGNSSGLLDPKARAGSQVRNAVISAARRPSVNPSVGAGLGVCTSAQFAAEGSTRPPAQPARTPRRSATSRWKRRSSKGRSRARCSSPSRTTRRPGNRAPRTRSTTLLALYLVARSPARGVIVKVAGKVDADPVHGAARRHLRRPSQLPYSRFNVHFRDGQRSLLATPSTCGVYMTGLDAESWLGTSEHVDSPFQLTKGIGGRNVPRSATRRSRRPPRRGR